MSQRQFSCDIDRRFGRALQETNMDFEKLLSPVQDAPDAGPSNSYSMTPEEVHLENMINGVDESAGPHLVNSADGRGTYDASQGPDPSLLFGRSGTVSGARLVRWRQRQRRDGDAGPVEHRRHAPLDRVIAAL
jgi:hypothetical protein